MLPEVLAAVTAAVSGSNRYPDPAATVEFPNGYNFKAFPKPGLQFMFFGSDLNPHHAS